MSLRQAAQQALEALERYGGVDQRACDAEEALRAALAEPEQEPVAWIQKTAVDWLTTTSSNAYIITTVMKNTNDEAYVPLYTAPTPRKPLTDEEIGKIAGDCLDAWSCARAIEAAHGIGEQI